MDHIEEFPIMDIPIATLDPFTTIPQLSFYGTFALLAYLKYFVHKEAL
jgi:hypothetical protein